MSVQVVWWSLDAVAQQKPSPQTVGRWQDAALLLQLSQITKRLYSSRHFLPLSHEAGYIIAGLVLSIEFWTVCGTGRSSV